jgi:hypothetical protein
MPKLELETLKWIEYDRQSSWPNNYEATILAGELTCLKINQVLPRKGVKYSAKDLTDVRARFQKARLEEAEERRQALT